MGKGKPRHNPDKKQNNYGSWCQYAELVGDKICCEGSYIYVDKCNSNPHNCIKNKYKNLASRSDKQKLEQN